MTTVFAVVTPVFAVILLGFLSGRQRWLPEGTGNGLAAFIFNISMPSLLFLTMATVKQTGVPPLGLIIGYFSANAATWVLASFATTRLLGRPLEEAPAIAMTACFGNTVMLGLPLGTAYYGSAAAAAIAVIVALHAPVLWIVASLQQEWIAQSSGGEASLQRIRTIALDIATNPIVFAVLTGSLWRLSGVGLFQPVEQTLALLGAGAVPGSLFALGFGLTRFEIRSDLRVTATIVGLKLLVMPVLGWLIASRLLHLAPIGTATVTLLAGCPTGANAFLFASRFQKAVGPVSGAIALGTGLSALTISLVLLLLPPG